MMHGFQYYLYINNRLAIYILLNISSTTNPAVSHLHTIFSPGSLESQIQQKLQSDELEVHSSLVSSEFCVVFM